jgi:spore coat polysaccharide biosynthesis protein SpsF
MNIKPKKKVIACVVARMNSTRLPRKSLLDVEGKSLIMRIIERLNESKTIDQVVICTSNHPDDIVLIDLAKKYDNIGFIAGSEQDVLSRLIDAAEKYDADIVLRVTGDNPFTDSYIIDQMVEHHIKTEAEYTRTINLPIGVTPDVLSFSMLPKLHQCMPDPNESEYLSLFAMDHSLYKCELLDAAEKMNRPYYSLTVDTPNDIEKVRYLYKKFMKTGHIPSLLEVIEEMDKDLDENSISGASPVKIPGGKTKTYDELLNWWEEQRLACENP